MFLFFPGIMSGARDRDGSTATTTSASSSRRLRLRTTNTRETTAGTVTSMMECFLYLRIAKKLLDLQMEIKNYCLQMLTSLLRCVQNNRIENKQLVLLMVIFKVCESVAGLKSHPKLTGHLIFYLESMTEISTDALAARID